MAKCHSRRNILAILNILLIFFFGIIVIDNVWAQMRKYLSRQTTAAISNQNSGLIPMPAISLCAENVFRPNYSTEYWQKIFGEAFKLHPEDWFYDAFNFYKQFELNSSEEAGKFWNESVFQPHDLVSFLGAYQNEVGVGQIHLKNENEVFN